MQNLRRTPSPGFWIALLLGIGTVAIWFMTRPCNAFKQSANMRKAAAHAAQIEPTIRADARFEQVRLSQYTGGACGCLWVRGIIATDADLASLQEAIAATLPSTEVLYKVDVDEERWKLHLPDLTNSPG